MEDLLADQAWIATEADGEPLSRRPVIPRRAATDRQGCRRAINLLLPCANVDSSRNADELTDHTEFTADQDGREKLDEESASWLAALNSAGEARQSALATLHDMLLRAASREALRRASTARIAGPELDDLAHQAADDAMVAVLGKLDTFRGESRFTTWAYRFAILEVSNKFGRHYWRRPTVSMDTEDWDRLPSRVGSDPLAHAEQQGLIEAVRHAVDETLTPHQRRLFVAVVVNGVPMDAVVAQSGKTHGAVYKVIFDARRKIRQFLIANGYLEDRSPGTGRAQRTGVATT